MPSTDSSSRDPRSIARGRARRLGAAAAAALASLALAGPALGPSVAGAVVLPVDSTAIVSGTPDLFGLLALPVGTARATAEAVSRDGSAIAFASTSDGLLGTDDDAVENVYLWRAGALTLVSVRSDGQPSHGSCDQPAVSADGTHVAFRCVGPLDPADTNDVTDVYLRDVNAGTTTLVSRGDGLGGAVGDRASADPSVSADGRYVAFTSSSDDFGTAGNAQRVYRRDTVAGATLLLSRTTLGAASSTSAGHPSVSADGSQVAFDTSEKLDAALDTNTNLDIYLRDVTNGTTELVSRQTAAAGGRVGNGPSFAPHVSGDGDSVAFTSDATNLSVADTDSRDDAYVRSRSATTTRLVSVRADNVKLDCTAAASGISDDGATIAFRSCATNVDPDADGVEDNAYVARGGAVQLVDRATDGRPTSFVSDVALSGDGAVAVYWGGVGATADVMRDLPSVVRVDVASGMSRTVSRPAGTAPFGNGGGVSFTGGLSPDGRYAAFGSKAPGLGAPLFGAERRMEAFVRDLETGQATLVSREDGPGGAPLNGDVSDVRVSADGRRAVFVEHPASGAASQVLVRDVPSGRTFVASRADGAAGAVGQGDSSAPSISEDGRLVAFQSSARGLTADDPDAQSDVFVRDLDAGRTLLVDRADGVDGRKASSAAEPSISGDGSSVAFASMAPGLVAGDADVTQDVFVRRLGGGRTLLASVTANGTKGDGGSESPSLDRDGNRVAFGSSAQNFGVGVASGIYVRDLAAGTLTLASRADGPGGTALMDAFAGAPLSADGMHVAFAAAAAVPIAPGAPGDGRARVFVRDLLTGTTRLVTRRSGAAGAALDGALDIGGITAAGGCVSFDADGEVLPAPVHTEFGQAYVRALTANCGRPVPPGGGGGSSRPAVLSRLALTPARFHVGGRGGGTRISFRLDQRAAVTLRFERLVPGRRVHGRCSARAHRGHRCTVARPAGRVVLGAGRLHAGANVVRFSGRIGRRALAPGRYRLTATPLDGRARRVVFTVLAPPRRPNGNGTR